MPSQRPKSPKVRVPRMLSIGAIPSVSTSKMVDQWLPTTIQSTLALSPTTRRLSTGRVGWAPVYSMILRQPFQESRASFWRSLGSLLQLQVGLRVAVLRVGVLQAVVLSTRLTPLTGSTEDPKSLGRDTVLVKSEYEWWMKEKRGLHKKIDERCMHEEFEVFLLTKKRSN